MYLSTCRIEIRTDRSWTASLRIFHDDLEDALQNQTGRRPTLNQSTLMAHQEPILTYLREHFIVAAASGINLDFAIVHLNLEGDVVTVVCDGNNLWSKSTHFITNDLLTEIFGSQKNVMTINCQEKIETLYFTKHASQHSTDI
jgi:hypothetical protein